MNSKYTSIINRLIEEDLPQGDITTDNLINNETIEAVIIARHSGVISGLSLVLELFQSIDENLYVKVINHDGTYVENGDIIAILSGSVKTILRAKDIALSVLTYMSSIASKVYDYRQYINNDKTKLLDTRKTTPSLRVLDKQAVIDGGGINHRFNLSDQAIITQDHMQYFDTVEDAVNTLRTTIDQNVILEVEVATYEQYLQALNTSCDMIMLSQMDVELIRKCVSNNHSNKVIEVRIESGRELARECSDLGVSFLSIEDLTSIESKFHIEIKLNK